MHSILTIVNISIESDYVSQALTRAIKTLLICRGFLSQPRWPVYLNSLWGWRQGIIATPHRIHTENRVIPEFMADYDKQDKPPRPFDLQVPHSLTLKPFNSNTGIKFWSMPKCTKSNSKGAAGMTLIANTEREHMLWCFSLKVWILDSYGGSIQSQKSKLYHDGIHIYIYQLIMYIYIYIYVYWLCSYCTII